MKKVIIIGSGIGGSGVGALIAKNSSHQVTLFEKNTIIGGRCASYEKIDSQGRKWEFDIGCHIVSTCNNGPLGEILRQCDRSNAIQWTITGPKVNLLGVNVSRKKRRTKRRGPEPSQERKENVITHINSMPVEETYQYDDISLKEFLENYQQRTGKSTNMLLFSMSPYIYFGTSPSKTSAGEFLRCFGTLNRSRTMGYPIGGTAIIPETYCDIIKENRGAIKIGKEGNVKRIIVENNQVKGIEVGPDNEFIEADIVISNSDIKFTVSSLVGEQHFPSEYVEYIKNLAFGGQGCSLKLGISKKVMDEKMLMYIPKYDSPSIQGKSLNELDISEMFFDDQRIPDKIPMLIVPLDNHDPSLAPEGCQNLHCVAVVKVNGTTDWSMEDEKKWEKVCMDTFLTLWPDLEQYIVVKDFIGPRQLAARFGKNGAGVGIGQIVGQVGEKRPSMISPIKGLFYCSGDAGGTKGVWGIGTELPARAALELYRILKENDFSSENIKI